MHLLLAAALLLQNKAAEDTFKEIEKRLEEAKTVSIAFTCEKKVYDRLIDQHLILKSSGIVLLKEGNKAVIAATVTPTNPGFDSANILKVSNGVTTAEWSSNEAPTLKALVSTPATHNARVLCRLLRNGIGGMGVVGAGMFIPPNVDSRNDPKVESKLSNFQFGPEDGQGKTLTFQINQGEFNGDVYPEGKGTIWYDPASYRLLKRTGSYGSGNVSFTETYTEFALNADIPDEKFKIPERKK